MYRKTATEKILSWGTAVSILLLWLIVSEFGLIDQNLVPTPQAVFAAFIEIMENGYKNFTLLEHLGESMKRLVIAFVLSCVTAVPLGIASGYNSRIRAIFEPIIEFYRPLPPLAYYTLLVLWMVLDASRYLRSDIIFLGIIVMGITGILLDRGIQLIERRVVPWKGKE